VSTVRPPDPAPPRIVFFVDRALGRKVAQTLRSAGEIVEVHDDHFAQNTLDVEWVPIIASRGWVVLTKDRRLKYRRLELLAISRSGLRLFTLTSGNMTADEMGRAFVGARGRMATLARTEPAPFIGKVYRDGRAVIWMSAEELRQP